MKEGPLEAAKQHSKGEGPMTTAAAAPTRPSKATPSKTTEPTCRNRPSKAKGRGTKETRSDLMACPSASWLKMSNALIEAFAKSAPLRLGLLLMIYRHTVGWNSAWATTTVTELARELSKSRQHTSEVLGKLVKTGAVIKRKSPMGGHWVELALTSEEVLLEALCAREEKESEEGENVLKGVGREVSDGSDSRVSGGADSRANGVSGGADSRLEFDVEGEEEEEGRKDRTESKDTKQIPSGSGRPDETAQHDREQGGAPSIYIGTSPTPYEKRLWRHWCINCGQSATLDHVMLTYMRRLPKGHLEALVKAHTPDIVDNPVRLLMGRIKHALNPPQSSSTAAPPQSQPVPAPSQTDAVPAQEYCYEQWLIRHAPDAHKDGVRTFEQYRDWLFSRPAPSRYRPQQGQTTQLQQGQTTQLQQRTAAQRATQLSCHEQDQSDTQSHSEACETEDLETIRAIIKRSFREVEKY